jgi:hypothetical protein
MEFLRGHDQPLDANSREPNYGKELIRGKCPLYSLKKMGRAGAILKVSLQSNRGLTKLCHTLRNFDFAAPISSSMIR